ncbi:hypothetical protein ACFQHO_04090 [Actinomadura yumaensis]|uniref:hypothetical protein n=1 Tax=Actinomadura yumaensis TaxID=111807 RepID=UPI00361AE6D4
MGVTREEAVGEGAELAAGDERHSRAVLPQGLGTLRAVGEERQDLLWGKVGGERGEPHFEAGVGGVPGGGAQPFGVAAGDAHGVAVQVVGDDRHVVPDLDGVEGLSGEAAAGEGPGVVVDATCAHVSALPHG